MVIKNVMRWKVAQFFEINWWKAYLRNQSPEEYLAYKKQYWHNLVKQIDLRLPPQTRVLDAGCGPAGIFTVLEACNIHAIDPLLEQYRAKLPHFQPALYPWVRFETVALENFTTAQPYEVVFCFNVINHVRNIQVAFDHLAAAVEQGGTLYISIDAHNSPTYKKWYRALRYFDILHPHQYDLAEYEAFLTERGFVVQRRFTLLQEKVFNYYLLVASKQTA